MEMGGGQVPPPGGGQQAGAGQTGGQTAQAMQRAMRTPETKPFFLTSEFLVWAITVVGVAIAGAAVGGDDGDDFGAATVWTLITVIGFAYIISRGISKAGTKYRGADGDPGARLGRY